MEDMRYSSPDARFQLQLPVQVIEAMLATCKVAKRNESGGILIGHYTPTHDCAIAVTASGPPKDSVSMSASFIRGVHGLKQRLRTVWQTPGDYYLGEWHYHPDNPPVPSYPDRTQMHEIARTTAYHCPEPLLVIIGGDPHGKWTLSVHVFLSSGEIFQLRAVEFANPPESNLKIMNTEQDQETESDFSLAGKAGMGGIIGGGGFDFQTRYILCHLVEWVSHPGFYQLFHEGAGDVDLRYFAEAKDHREHFQVKDHSVTPAEFKDVVKTFVGYDTDMPGVYAKFVLAAPAVSQELKPLINGLRRLRNSEPYYDTVPDALKSTVRTVKERIAKVGLSDHEDFILSQVYFDLELNNCHDDYQARTYFFGTMILRDKSEIWRRLTEVQDRVYESLFTEVTSRRGAVLTKPEVDAILDRLALDISASAPEHAIAVIGVHNWAREKLSFRTDYEIDWSHHFNRDQRQVPDTSTWNLELVPELKRMKTTLLADKGSGLLRIAGSGCLSTQIALGLNFRELEGWVIETIQRPTNVAWRSDAPSSTDYQVQIEETVVNTGATEIAFLVSVKNDVHMDVVEYLANSGKSVCAVINILPPTGASSLSIKSNGDAIALAIAARDALRAAQEKYRVKSTHMFISGPQALALFLGQRITSMGSIQLYEYQDPGYTPSCLLTT